jgi:hypothetical protein
MIEVALGWAPAMRLLDGVEFTYRWMRGDYLEKAR